MFTATQPTSPGTGPVTDPVRVMVVDDSVVIRGLIGRWVDADPALAVVASHRNGQLAVDDIERSNPDVVILDIEMPVMDGLTALPLMLAKKRDLVIVMASTLTRRNAEISLKALSLGAQDYVPKPESTASVSTSVDFRSDLIQKVRFLGQRRRDRVASAAARRPMRAETNAGRVASTSARPVQRTAREVAAAAAPKATFTLRPYSAAQPRVLAIGSSTGGPQALQQLFRDIAPAIRNVPVLVTQHMPPTFTAILAEHIAKVALCPAAEAEDGDVLQPGRIYVAPGGKHMVVEKRGTDVVARLNDEPPVNFCKPAVDPMFDSVSKAYGSAALAVVLTGMGSDGANGARTIAGGGGSVIAQDEKTSVVWGMPGATAHTGQCSDVLPLTEIGPKVARIFGGRR